MRIDIHEYAYHRNGICGLGFLLVDFTLFHEDGEDNLYAIIPSQATPNEGDAVRVYVIDPDDIDNKWRGDEIAGLLIPMLEAENVDVYQHEE